MSFPGAGKVEDNIFFINEFNWDSEDEIIPDLYTETLKQVNVADGHIDLIINSVGGYAHVLRQMLDIMAIGESYGVVYRTVVMGHACSAGSMLAVAGTKGYRYISPTAKHLVHYGYTGSDEATPLQAERNQKYKDEHWQFVLNHYKAHAKIPRLEKQLADDHLWLNADEALNWKLADHSLEEFDPHELTRP